MERIEKTFELAVPASMAYSRWLSFDQEKGWHGDITERVPGKVVAWRSRDDAGRVRFEEVDGEHTRVRVAVEYEHDASGEMPRRVDETVEEFRRFVEVGAG